MLYGVKWCYSSRYESRIIIQICSFVSRCVWMSMNIWNCKLYKWIVVVRLLLHFHSKALVFIHSQGNFCCWLFNSYVQCQIQSKNPTTKHLPLKHRGRSLPHTPALLSMTANLTKSELLEQDPRTLKETWLVPDILHCCNWFRHLSVPFRGEDSSSCETMVRLHSWEQIAPKQISVVFMI